MYRLLIICIDINFISIFVYRPDINMIRSLPSVPISIKAAQPQAVARVAAQDERELPRQASLADGEGIKIVIHDVDSDHGIYN